MPDARYEEIKYSNNFKYLGEDTSQNASDKESFQIRKLKLNIKGLYSDPRSVRKENPFQKCEKMCIRDRS